MTSDMKKTTLFNGRGFDVVQYKNYNMVREIVERVDAACVLAFDNDRVILVEQEWIPFGKILEVPAGKVEKGESSLDCAIRELREETGYSVKTQNISHLCSYYPSIGYTTEMIHCYLAKDLEFVGSSPDEGENIKLVGIKPDDLEFMIKGGDITDSKTIISFLVWKNLETK